MAEPNVFGSLFDILSGLQSAPLGGPTEESVAAARHAERMAKVHRLASEGATLGERHAAEEALHRMQMDALDAETDDYIPL